MATLLRHGTDPSSVIGLIYSAFKKLSIGKCGKGFRVRPSLVIAGGGAITIGNNFSSMGQDYLYANDNGSFIVGDNCSLSTNVQLGASGGKIAIGNNVMIAPNVVIRAANHGMNRDSPMRVQPHTFGEIIIDDDVWIGSNAVVTSGVRLATGTIVGAGAVVTRSTEPYTIVGGVPARKIGERI